MTDLPKLKCGGCITCCEGDTIPLMPSDDVTKYKTQLINGQRFLAKKKNGNCVYLGKSGCQIYLQQPLACRNMDCRKYALAFDKMPDHEKELRSSGHTHRVISEGKRRLADIGM